MAARRCSGLSAALVAAALLGACSGSKGVVSSATSTTATSDVVTTLEGGSTTTLPAGAAVPSTAGPGGDLPPSTTPTSAKAGNRATSTTAAAGATPDKAASLARLRGAMLVAADLPGLAADADQSQQDDDSFANCIPGNPLSAEHDPDGVFGTSFSQTEGAGQGFAQSTGRVGPAVAAATDFVTRFDTDGVRECLRKALVQDDEGDSGTTSSATVQRYPVRGGDQAAGLVVDGSASGDGGGSFTIYLGLVRKGASVAFVVSGVFKGPGATGPSLPTAEVDRRLGLVAGRL